MGKREPSIAQVIQELGQTIADAGIKETLTALRSVRKLNEFPGELVFVISNICSHFNIDIIQLRERIHTDDYLICRGFIVYYSRHYYNVQWPMIAKALQRDQSNLHRACQVVMDLKKDDHRFGIYYDMKAHFNKLVKTYKPKHK